MERALCPVETFNLMGSSMHLWIRYFPCSDPLLQIPPESFSVSGANLMKSGDERIKLQGDFKDLEQPNEPDPSTTCSARYECNVCLKSFSSHQALGGHKASHSKEKSSPSEETTNIERMNEGPDLSVKPVTDPASSSHSHETSRRPLEFDLNEMPPLEGEEC